MQNRTSGIVIFIALLILAVAFLLFRFSGEQTTTILEERNDSSSVGIESPVQFEDIISDSRSTPFTEISSDLPSRNLQIKSLDQNSENLINNLVSFAQELGIQSSQIDVGDYNVSWQRLDSSFNYSLLSRSLNISITDEFNDSLTIDSVFQAMDRTLLQGVGLDHEKLSVIEGEKVNIRFTSGGIPIYKKGPVFTSFVSDDGGEISAYLELASFKDGIGFDYNVVELSQQSYGSQAKTYIQEDTFEPELDFQGFGEGSHAKYNYVQEDLDEVCESDSPELVYLYDQNITDFLIPHYLINCTNQQVTIFVSAI